ncbi:hypothetical protein HPB49_015139 [Dermacentor silvarum]|uniref:Uncharacterized protein n=1 Tax=Dermacentor silvarum TaxID=543639 RepID=A0ACB8E130_DERSI|nr:baculoviral IAP repeat-containing protein 5 [Dermacentor silvarum]KAH7980335.1 hypothetical protein HPB49_015139 [Dermacentor silvarum]
MSEDPTPPINLSLRAVLEQKTDAAMHHVVNRLATFKDWPFSSDSPCSPARMADAGFYHCPTENEPDLARCYVCLKEMAEWKLNDDPLEEHARSTDCEFLRLGKKPQDLTVLDFLQLEKARTKNRVRKYMAVREAEKTVNELR